ncbi:MAG: hypothetical protein K0U66_10755 [Gammaproteobacteria bacterium]|nr:hypothetical protein [Gammaproteobacteria bacterium]
MTATATITQPPNLAPVVTGSALQTLHAATAHKHAHSEVMTTATITQPPNLAPVVTGSALLALHGGLACANFLSLKS